VSQPHAKIVIIGGGPGGYEAALVAAQLGADVTVVDSDGLGGACVLTDCVPSKTLIATSDMMAALDRAAALGIRPDPGTSTGAGPGGTALATVDAPRLYSRVKALARAQSGDVAQRLAAEGVEVVAAAGRLTGPRTVAAGDRELGADAVLVASGARPRVLPDAVPDGERILTCRQL
jgi:NAD(P)H dehydrogenase (quinone)